VHTRRVVHALGAVLLLLAGVGMRSTPAAAADACSDVEVIFARGTSDRAGIGVVGRAFVDALTRKLIGKSIDTYAVNYPADWDFSKSTSLGAADANQRVRAVAQACPRTKIVLGGISQGAGVIDLIAVGNRKIWFFTTAPLPAAMGDHIAAAAVFGNPSRNFPGLGPLPKISPMLADKAIDLCAFGDPYCSAGNNYLAHLSYPFNGMVDQAATFAAKRVLGRDV
jgi:cutinase